MLHIILQQSRDLNVVRFASWQCGQSWAQDGWGSWICGARASNVVARFLHEAFVMFRFLLEVLGRLHSAVGGLFSL